MRKRNRHKIIIGIEVMILSITVSLLGTNAASANPPSNGVSYNKNGQVTVENALDNLYSKANYGNATANDILKGKKALVGGKEVVGTFTCPPMSSDQTPGDATPEDITDGKIAWVNGNKIVGTYASTPTTLADRVELGDYINYYPTVSQISIDRDITGTNGSSIINPSETERWEVIRINPDDTVEIVPQWTNGSFVRFGQGINYFSAMSEILMQYVDIVFVKNVRLIQKDDLELIRTDAGYLKFYNAGGEAISYWTGHLTDDGLAKWPSFISEDERIMDYTLDSLDTNHTHAIRPIITLKASINIMGGDGTYSNPYKIGKKA